MSSFRSDVIMLMFHYIFMMLCNAEFFQAPYANWSTAREGEQVQDRCGHPLDCVQVCCILVCWVGGMVSFAGVRAFTEGGTRACP